MTHKRAMAAGALLRPLAMDDHGDDRFWFFKRLAKGTRIFPRRYHPIPSNTIQDLEWPGAVEFFQLPASQGCWQSCFRGAFRPRGWAWAICKVQLTDPPWMIPPLPCLISMGKNMNLRANSGYSTTEPLFCLGGFDMSLSEAVTPPGKLERFLCWFDLQSTLWPSDWGSLDRWFISWWASHDSRFQVCLNVIFPYFPLETTIGISLKNWTITMALEAFDGKMKASNHKFRTLGDLWQSISSHEPKTTKQNHHSMIFLYNIVYTYIYKIRIYNIYSWLRLDGLHSIPVFRASIPNFGPIFSVFPGHRKSWRRRSFCSNTRRNWRIVPWRPVDRPVKLEICFFDSFLEI